MIRGKHMAPEETRPQTVRELPYRLAVVVGQMTAPDHAQQQPQRFPLPGRGVHRWKAVLR